MTTVLTVSNLSKTFFGQRVLSEVSLAVDAGEIHGLIGQNGSGKSTLIKVLAGYHVPDPGGEVRVDGKVLAPGSPAASEASGLRFVHQDLGLVESLSTVENLALGPGYASTRLGLISWPRERRAAEQTLGRLGHDIDVTRPVGELPMASRTAVAVARALSSRSGEPKVVVLDEPTATLPPHETELLLDLMSRVSATGVGVVFVSHHLEEVIAACSRVSVLRDGLLVASAPIAGNAAADLVEMMIGQRIDLYDAAPARAGAAGPAKLVIDGLATTALHGISFTVGAGEIVGLAGLTGSGREEAAQAIFGGLSRQGMVSVSGQLVPPRRPDRSIAAGIGLVPADRHANAVFAGAAVRENLSVVNLRALAPRGLIQTGREQAEVGFWLGRVDVRPPQPERLISTLSGGNQQKVILARWLRQNPQVLILDEPTQGVDVGAKAEIHALVDAAAEAGAAVLVASTESEELARLCDRVLVLRGGRITAWLEGPQVSAGRITAATLDSGPAPADSALADSALADSALADSEPTD
jgi:ribose transport system ATP-binding protein